MRATLLLLSIFGTAELRAQAATDTTVRVTGIVKAALEGASHWGLFLPATIVVRRVRISWLPIAAEARGIGNHQDHFVEATGTLRIATDTGGAMVVGLVDPAVIDIDPSGTVRRDVRLSFTQRAVVTLAVEPSRFAWHDSSGTASGVRPVLFFGLVNQGDAPIQLIFPRYEVFCVRVRSLENTAVDTAWTIQLPGVRNTSIVMGGHFRDLFELPSGAAPIRGRYRVRVELCAGSEYGAETTFEVTG
jgi:hypothetical protein